MLSFEGISRVSVICAGLVFCHPLVAAPPSTKPIDGLRDNTPQVYALTGARIVVAPGQVIDSGTVLIRDGIVSAVGADLEAPPDARRIDLTGRTIYAGFLDAYSETATAKLDPKVGAPYWNPEVTPQLDVARQFTADAELNKKLRSQGVTARLVAPANGVIKGRSAVVTTADGAATEVLLRDGAAQHVRLTVKRGRDRRSYPNSPMGAVALARQCIYDARWYHDARQAFDGDPSLPQPERNEALAALDNDLGERRLFVVDAPDQRYLMRADRWGREFGISVAIRGSGHEYRRIESLRNSGRTVIVPLNFPKAPNVATPESARNVTLEQLMHWDIAPENAARLERAGIPFVLTGHGLEDPAQFLAKLREAVQRGLSRDEALRGLTTRPAQLLKVDRLVGTIERGKMANLFVADGDIFEDGVRVLETWVAGQRHEIVERPEVDLRGRWEIRLSGAPSKLKRLYLDLDGQPDQLQGTVGTRAGRPGKEGQQPTIKLSQATLRQLQFHATFAGSRLGVEGILQLSAAVSLKGNETTWMGKLIWPDGQRVPLTAIRLSGPKSLGSRNKQAADTVDDAKGPKSARDASQANGKKGGNSDKPKVDRAASFDANFPLGAFAARKDEDRLDVIVFRGATVWTASDNGVLEDADVLVRRGKILAVGRGLEIPEDAAVVDCQGKHITPGIVDCHSHMATDGGVNESTQAVTAEVRIGDFIDAEDIAIYRQLAGGVTCANILHGSANPIGGQNQVVKLRWGLESEYLKFAEAPAGIKFALGENVKQSNWGEKYTTRYPQTRMGVVEIMRDALAAARDYRNQHKRWQAMRSGLPPRIDLELEAIAEVVEGRRWIHCHSYRQDEILALIRTLDDFGIQIGTFQHILEGYKVADAMQKHGATGSAFSDWWAYKFEVYDAIPYNGALMHRAGVNVSFNSDSRELARHLNQEAAKAVKYGGLASHEALKFVTLNPAMQLRVDKWVGSLTPGKHADVVVWSGHPLSNFSRCEQTWIDGRKYFDIRHDVRRRAEASRMHQALVQKVLASGAAMKEPGEDDDEDKQLWPRHDIFCAHGHGHGHHH